MYLKETTESAFPFFPVGIGLLLKECASSCGNCGYAHVTSQTRSMSAFPGSVRRRLLAKPGRWRHHRHNSNCCV
nr:MAG TPA: hypothetical protein [Caudoviricetes sp.]